MPSDRDTFSHLLADARAGDPGAFATLWRRTNPGLVRYLQVLCGSQAEDVASDTWIRIMRGLAGFQGTEAGWHAWVVTLARRQWIDTRRHRARRPEIPFGQAVAAGAEDLAGVGTVDREPYDEVVERLGTREALRLVASLPPETAEMVALRVIVGLDVAAVADVVGKSPGAVRVAVHRGLRRLAAGIRLLPEQVTAREA